MSATVVRACAARLRLEKAAAWLDAQPPGHEVLVVATTLDAANELLRTATRRSAAGASFGWHRATLGQLAASLAQQALVDTGRAPVGALACEAVVARVVHASREAKGLGRFESIADGPGFARAVSRSLAELRFAGAHAPLLDKHAPELRDLFAAYESELEAAGLADRAAVFWHAVAAARDAGNPHPWLGLPTLLLDVAADREAERALLAEIEARAPEVLVTTARGDEAPIAGDEIDLDTATEDIGSSLRRLQRHLFEDVAPEPAPIGEDVVVLSAPGESRECVEIARHIHALAGQGLAFDRMAVLLRGPEEYRAHLEESFARARIPAHFARGAIRPDPAGRAFLALLACAGEGLSARRFAEYLSLGEVPDAGDAGKPPAARGAGDRWVAPDEELVPAVVSSQLEQAASEPAPTPEPTGDPESTPVVAGTLRAPRRWEQLLVDAAVIGGRDRWERRLAGLAHELAADLEELDDPDDPVHERIGRDLDRLTSLRDFALPLLDVLEALPRSGSWGDWLDALGALATRSLRHPERVLAVLSELAPMADVGPIALGEVRLVLSRRLLSVAAAPLDSRLGRVFVAPIEAARGLDFDVVFVPGLAERMFPKKITQDPVLPDPVRARLAGEGISLPVDADRIRGERRALRLAAGAAGQRIFFSYPRLDLDQSRPRVPSFYALEALRAAEGTLPGFDELAKRAETTSDARVGWPAPARPEDAIDEAEHDLALLDQLTRLPQDQSVGTARYLIGANPHLGRALRFRARRWLKGWTVADGLIKPSAAAQAAIARHTLDARSYSPTALQNFASCPYKFFLYAVHRLSPREVPEAIEDLSPLQRGSLVHEVQFELFERLREDDLLPVTADRFDRVRAIADEVLTSVAERHHDELAPAIERVWEDGVSSVRADLREWLQRGLDDESGFVPWRFEFSFGLPGRRERDPHSTPEPIELECGIRLRGSIDLVERRDTGELRVTDHKTGKVRVNKDAVVSGGESLQPVLYALAAERALDARVESGRLYYCTAAGGFAARETPVDRRARDSAQQVADTIGEALSEPFLPAAPAERACRFCDYQVVCGPYEEQRTGLKWKPALAKLNALRELP